MEKFSYESIKPLVTKEELQGSQLTCEFTCPKTGKMVATSTYVTPSTSSQMKQNLKRGFIYSLRSTLNSLLYRLLSSFGTVGNMVGNATSTVTNSVNINSQPTISKKDKENAIVQAFKNIASKFQWDEQEKQWISV